MDYQQELDKQLCAVVGLIFQLKGFPIFNSFNHSLTLVNMDKTWSIAMRSLAFAFDSLFLSNFLLFLASKKEKTTRVWSFIVKNFTKRIRAFAQPA